MNNHALDDPSASAKCEEMISTVQDLTGLNWDFSDHHKRYADQMDTYRDLRTTDTRIKSNIPDTALQGAMKRGTEETIRKLIAGSLAKRLEWTNRGFDLRNVNCSART